MGVVNQTSGGVKRLLEGEPLPIPPRRVVIQGTEQIHPELEKYLRDLHNYLRRLNAAFSNTIVQIMVEKAMSTGQVLSSVTITCNGDSTFTVTPTYTTVLVPGT